MTGHRFAVLAAELLRQKPADARSRPVDRDQDIAVLTRALASRQARQRRRKWVWAGGALAAAAASALLVGWRPQASDGRLAATVPCADGADCSGSGPDAVDVGHFGARTLLPGQSVVAKSGELTSIRFDSGTQMLVRENSSIEYRQGAATRRFGLDRGSLWLRVAKLHQGQRFLVDTPDAEVEVRGTVFEVKYLSSAESCAGTRTRVLVREGHVLVRSNGKDVMLSPGSAWPSDCDAAKQVPSHERADTQPASSRTRRASRSKTIETAVAGSEPAAALGYEPKEALSGELFSRPRSSDGPREAVAPLQPVDQVEPRSDLEQQNDLFAAASRARRQGDLAGALSGYEQLLQRYPGGPLTESATVERMRLLGRMAPSRGASAARAYLRDFPNGFARAEAERLTDMP